jgi:hypothetical protein
MTKIDQVQSSSGGGKALGKFCQVPDLSAQWFEPGCKLGCTLKVLTPPVFDKCKAISIHPMELPEGYRYCPDLGEGLRN